MKYAKINIIGPEDKLADITRTVCELYDLKVTEFWDYRDRDEEVLMDFWPISPEYYQKVKKAAG